MFLNVKLDKHSLHSQRGFVIVPCYVPQKGVTALVCCKHSCTCFGVRVLVQGFPSILISRASHSNTTYDSKRAFELSSCTTDHTSNILNRFVNLIDLHNVKPLLLQKICNCTQFDFEFLRFRFLSSPSCIALKTTRVSLETPNIAADRVYHPLPATVPSVLRYIVLGRPCFVNQEPFLLLGWEMTCAIWQMVSIFSWRHSPSLFIFEESIRQSDVDWSVACCLWSYCVWPSLWFERCVRIRDLRNKEYVQSAQISQSQSLHRYFVLSLPHQLQ